MGFRVHWSKTKLMHVGDGLDPPCIDIDGTQVEFISYAYLNSTVRSTGDVQEEMYRRRGLSAAAMYFL